MVSRKHLLAGGLAAIALSGCAAYPYEDDARYYERPYYSGTYYDRYDSPYYGPRYYTGPSVGFGITYTDRDYRRRHWR